MADDDAPELNGAEGAQGASRGASCVHSGLHPADADSGSEDGMPVEEFSLDKQEEADTTALQHRLQQRDLQGIPWERLQVSREAYRQQRVAQYHNYTNCIKEEDWDVTRQEMLAGWLQPATLPPAAAPYAFTRNWRAVASSIVHFQLRNLLWASSAHDVFVVYDNRVQHWNSVTRAVSDVLDLRGAPKGPRIPGLSRVQVSTLCVSDGLVAAGGFTGELVLARLSRTDEEAEAEEEEEEEDEEEEGAGPDWLQWDAAVDDSRQGWLQTGSMQLRQPPVCQQHHQQQQQQQSVLSRRTQQLATEHGRCRWACEPWLERQCSLKLPQQQQQVQQSQACSSSHQQRQQQQQQQQQRWGMLPQPQQHHHQRQQQQQSGRPPQRAVPEALLGAAGPAAAEVLHSWRVTQSENGITNGIEIFNSCNYGHCVMTSNNDCCVRLFDVATGRPRQRLAFPFAVNYATLRPAGAALGGGAVAAVVGDDPATWLVDCRSGLEVMQLKGHRDYSFAAAWHPAGQLLATGNQDSTTRVWDVRSPGSLLAVLAGTMGAIRSLRFSPDGAFLAAAEPADFVHVYDVTSGFRQSQKIDLFGEVAGVTFSPGAAHSLFITISDTLYSSLVQYRRVC